MITNRIKRGASGSLPNGAAGEPLFTTDTYELYIGKGDGTNQRYQKYIASGTTSQYLRGDGTLETHNLDSLTDVIVSSPSNGQILQYNGTYWVNSAGGFLTGGATAAGQVGVFDSTTNIVGYTTFTYDTVTDKLSMTNGYVNNTLTVDGQLVIKSESGASAYTRGLKFPDNSYGGTGDIAGLRLHNAGGENIILELYAGNDSLDTINFAVAAGGSTYNDNVTINGNKIWNVGNLPSPINSTGSITSGEIPIFSNSTTVYSDTALFWDNSLNRLGVGGTSPNAQVGVSTSSGVNAFGYRTSGASYYELVLAYDNTTYGHTFQANRGSTTSARNITFLNGSNTVSIDENGNMGIGLIVPNPGTSGPGGLGLDIYASTTAALALHNATSGTGISAGGRIYYNSTNMTVRNLSAGNLTMTVDSGNFVVITNGAENVKVEGSTGRVGIGNPASIAEMLTVNGSIQQSAVTSAITKTDANGKIVAAVAGTDYVAPSALSGYVPTSRTLTINGTTYDLSANRSWTVGIIDGGGSAGRVTYWSDPDTVTSDGGFIYDSSTKRLGVNTTVPNATIGATAASGYGLLIKNADSNYGGIGMGVDATYGNLINTEKLGTAPARNLTLLNQSGYISLDESGNMGVNILTPNASTSGPGGIGIDIYSSTTAALAFHNSTSGTGSAEGGRIYYNSTNMTIRNLETGNISITADNGNFQVITLGAENIKVEGSTGKVGIGAPASIAEMLTVNGSIQQSGVTNALLKANASGKIIAAVAGTDYIVGNFDATATVRARTPKTTYRNNINNPPTDAPVRSLTNNEDNWIYLDTASTEWGIYHRNIDSTLSVAGQPDLPPNSIAFIGANNLQGYISLETGRFFAKEFVRNGGTSSQFLKADGSVDGTSYQPLLSSPVTGNSSVTGRLARWTGTTTIGESLIFDSANRAIAIANTSVKNWQAPFYVIEGGTHGQFLGYQTNGPIIKLGVNTFYNGANYIYTNSNFGVGILDITADATNAGLRFYSAPAGTAGNAASITSPFGVDVTNNISYFNTFLGVGRAITPTTTIEAFNSDNASTVIQARRMGYGITGQAVISLAGENLSGVALSRAQIRAVFSTNTSSMDTNMDFHTTTGTTDISSATLRMRITPTGRIGINTTTIDSFLHIAGANSQVTSAIYQIIESTDSSAGLLIKSNSTGSYPFIRYNQGSSGKFEHGITGSGDGTGAGNFYMNFNTGTGADNAAFFIGSGGQVRISRSTAQSTPLLLNTTNQHQYFMIDSSSGYEAMTRYQNPAAGSWYCGIRTSNGMGSTSSYHIYSSVLNNDVFALNTDGSGRINGSLRAGYYNTTALLVAAAGTGSTNAAIAVQQVTGEGDTLIFADYEPYAEYGMVAKNNTDSIDFNGGDSSNNITSYNIVNRSGSTRTAYVKMRVSLGSGNVQIGGNTTINTLAGSGNRTVYSDSNGLLTNSSSDIRLKRDINILNYGLSDLLKLNPVSFYWIPPNLGLQREIGFIAQQVKDIIPELVGMNRNGLYSLDYAKLTPLLVKAIQEQQQQINELKSKLN